MKAPVIVALAMLLVFGSASCTTTEPTTSCCRVCRTGKPCGDSCISRDKQCSKPRGCACSGVAVAFGFCTDRSFVVSS